MFLKIGWQDTYEIIDAPYSADALTDVFIVKPTVLV
jgi:hypothetical protein